MESSWGASSSVPSPTQISPIGRSGSQCTFVYLSVIRFLTSIFWLQSRPAYIAGVTNPIFESSGSWDLLCDVGTGRIVVSKDINTNHPPSNTTPAIHTLARTGTLKAEGSLGSEDEMTRPSKDLGADRRGEFKPDNADNLFMEDVRIFIPYSHHCVRLNGSRTIFQITSAIQSHFGEAHVRARFQEYTARFVRLAARYEEDILGIQTTIGYPNAIYTERLGDHPRLGSGLCFSDEVAGHRELSANASRIDAWRRTESYTLYQVVSHSHEGWFCIHRAFSL